MIDRVNYTTTLMNWWSRTQGTMHVVHEADDDSRIKSEQEPAGRIRTCGGACWPVTVVADAPTEGTARRWPRSTGELLESWIEMDDAASQPAVGRCDGRPAGETLTSFGCCWWCYIIRAGDQIGQPKLTTATEMCTSTTYTSTSLLTVTDFEINWSVHPISMIVPFVIFQRKNTRGRQKTRPRTLRLCLIWARSGLIVEEFINRRIKEYALLADH